MPEKSVQTLDRALDIIELLSGEREGLGVTEIGQRIGLHKSTVHRLINALADRGYIEKDIKQGNYKLGLKLVEISSLFLKKLELKTEAEPYLRRLAGLAGQPVHLGILSDKDVIYIEKVEPVNSIRMYSQIGRRVPAYCSALGKVLLSGLDNKELKSLVGGIEFKRYTPNTIGSKEALLKEIDKVRKCSWAIDDEEYEAGIRCIAAPVFDYTGKMIAAISTSGERKSAYKESDEELSKQVMEAALSISKRMGYTFRT
jgi:IclR family transcriptional regulator, KDG regulon repressor